MDDDPSSDKGARLRMLKEDLRKKHAERLIQKCNITNETDNDLSLSRFSKYRRSGSEKHERAAAPPPLPASLPPNLSHTRERYRHRQRSEEVQVFELPCPPAVPPPPPPIEVSEPSPDLDKEFEYCPLERETHSQFVTRRRELSPPPPTSSNMCHWRDVERPLFRNRSDRPQNIHNIESSGSGHFDESSPSHFQNDEVHFPSTLKKPNIPIMLKPSTSRSKIESRIPSILKRESQHNSNTVSFDLEDEHDDDDEQEHDHELNKSIESIDTETGYWSGEGTPGGILKNSKSRTRDHDKKSILKQRRSSLGNASYEPDEIQGILKRKLSYDSSVHRRQIMTNSLSISCDSLSPDRGSILKKRSTEDLDDENPKPILKKYERRERESDPIKPILKKFHKDWGDNENARGNASILKCHFESSHSLPESGSERDLYYGTEESRRRVSEPNYRTSIEIRNPSSSRVPHCSKMEKSESEESIIMTLSVAEKRSLFMQMEMENKAGIRKKRFTQPITMDEVVEAEKLVGNEAKLKESKMESATRGVKKLSLENLEGSNLVTFPGSTKFVEGAQQPNQCASLKVEAEVKRKTPVPLPRKSLPVPVARSEVKPIPPKRTLTSPVQPEPEPDDCQLALPNVIKQDPSKLSLRERVRLFDGFSSTKLPVKKPVTSKRFTTQPVTSLELLHCELQGGPSSVKTPSEPGQDQVDRVQSPALQPDNGLKSLGILKESSLISSSQSVKGNSVEKMPEKIISERSEGETSSDSSDNGESNFVKSRLRQSSSCTFSQMSEEIQNQTIAEKILALKTNGELNWKRRLSQNDELKTNNKDSKISSRLSLLEKSQDGWKSRVSENDATLFTVQGKLEKAGKLDKVSKTELLEKKLKIKLPILGNNKLNDENSKAIKKESTESKPQPKIQSFSAPVTKNGKLQFEYGSQSKTSASAKTIEIAQNDNETFTSFYPSPVPSSNTSVDLESLDSIPTTSKLTGLRKNLKYRKHKDTKNPLKSAQFTKQSYTEVEVKESVLKRPTIDLKPQFTMEALQGLASQEDFANIKLKKGVKHLEPYPNPMLIQVKGKRFVQTRVVQPVCQSLNSGDCFILLTPDKVFTFIGEFANRMEKTKTTDIVQHIRKKKDIGVKSNAEFFTIEDSTYSPHMSSFCNLLGGGTLIEDSNKLGDEHDEQYEIEVVKSNCVYELSNDKLVLLESGTLPRYCQLNEEKVLVFDFQSELYVWSGSRADPELKKSTQTKAKELFESKASARPTWAMYKKINQKMEPIIFVEKFFDWPDDSFGRVIKIRNKSDLALGEIGFNYKPCNIQDMIQSIENVEDPRLELEGLNVCRVSDRTSLQTTCIKKWLISEFSKTPVSTTAQFYSGETYVIKWQYRVTTTSRDLKGNESKHVSTQGRERTAYFFWHGRDSSLTGQGATALMTVELDEEKGPQIRVEQGEDSPAFLTLFNGTMVVHSGLSTDSQDTRLYIALGSVEVEGHLLEVPFQSNSFRSRGSFVLVDFKRKLVFIWHGFCSSLISKKISRNISKSYSEFKAQEVNEGSEPESFLKYFTIINTEKWRESYASLSEQRDELKIFHFTTLTGSFEYNLIQSPFRKVGVKNHFPMLQENLYNQQTNLFLLSNGTDTYLWNGPVDEENRTGSSELKSTSERRAAIMTSIEYCQKFEKPGYFIHSGQEPTAFKSFFPYWHDPEGAGEESSELLTNEIKKFQKTNYTLEELQMKPDGVDVSKLESYLSDSDFEELLKMSRESFGKLQAWRQTELKKSAGLF